MLLPPLGLQSGLRLYPCLPALPPLRLLGCLLPPSHPSCPGCPCGLVPGHPSPLPQPLQLTQGQGCSQPQPRPSPEEEPHKSRSWRYTHRGNLLSCDRGRSEKCELAFGNQAFPGGRLPCCEVSQGGLTLGTACRRAPSCVRALGVAPASCPIPVLSCCIELCVKVFFFCFLLEKFKI